MVTWINVKNELPDLSLEGAGGKKLSKPCIITIQLSDGSYDIAKMFAMYCEDNKWYFILPVEDDGRFFKEVTSKVVAWSYINTYKEE